MATLLKILDIGHKGYSLDQAISVLETEVSTAIFEGKVRGIKIIHGHGSGTLKAGVRSWCETQAGRFQAVINGEDYDLFHPDAAGMRAECRSPRDADLGRKNSAVTYIWLW